MKALQIPIHPKDCRQPRMDWRLLWRAKHEWPSILLLVLFLAKMMR